MISDELLKAILEVDARGYAESYRQYFGNTPNAVEAGTKAIQGMQEMAAELLQRRDADRAIWENAPDWAEWFARDSDSIGFYYSEEPEQGTDYWIEGGRNWPMREWGWKSSKQERPK